MASENRGNFFIPFQLFVFACVALETIALANLFTYTKGGIRQNEYLKPTYSELVNDSDEVVGDEHTHDCMIDKGGDGFMSIKKLFNSWGFQDWDVIKIGIWASIIRCIVTIIFVLMIDFEVRQGSGDDNALKFILLCCGLNILFVIFLSTLFTNKKLASEQYIHPVEDEAGNIKWFGGKGPGQKLAHCVNLGCSEFSFEGLSTYIFVWLITMILTVLVGLFSTRITEAHYDNFDKMQRQLGFGKAVAGN